MRISIIVARKIPKAEAIKKGEEVLKWVGLSDKKDYYPSQLSGGQQQRVAIARALMNNPPVILADEPTGNLDTKATVEIVEFLQNLNAKGITIVMVTHEPDVAAYAKRQVVMRDGKVASDSLVEQQVLAATTAPTAPAHEEVKA